MFRAHKTCRVCGTALGAPYLDLGCQPLSNALVGQDAPREETYPLQVVRCGQCGLSQLTVVVDPAIRYHGYRYRSGVSPAWVEHCQPLAHECFQTIPRPNDGQWPRALDIAANDGTMVRALMDAGYVVTGIDPSPCDTDPRSKPCIRAQYWDQSVADDLAKWYPKFSLVVAQNVLNHVDDPVGFLRAAKTVLDPDGQIVVEVPRWHPEAPFDTVYHEHLSYWTLDSLREACHRAGLMVARVDDVPVHGGSLQVWLSHHPTHDHYQRVQDRVWETIHRIDDHLWPLPRNYRMLGWGAAAKATVLLNAYRHQHPTAILPQSIIDETPEKQGLYVPGVRVPIVPPPESLADVDVLWVLAWNGVEAIRAKAKARGFAGVLFVTHPEPRFLVA